MCGPWSLRQRREGRLCNVESGQLIPVANTAPKGIAVPAVLVDSDPACWFVGGVAQRLAADALAGCVVLVDEDRRNARPELMKDAQAARTTFSPALCARTVFPYDCSSRARQVHRGRQRTMRQRTRSASEATRAAKRRSHRRPSDRLTILCHRAACTSSTN